MPAPAVERRLVSYLFGKGFSFLHEVLVRPSSVPSIPTFVVAFTEGAGTSFPESLVILA